MNQINIITPKRLANGIRGIRNACNMAPRLRKAHLTEGVDEFIKMADREKVGMKKPYVKPKSTVVSAESDSHILASSDSHHDNGNHYGQDNGNGNGHGHGRGNDYDDDSFGFEY